MVTEIGSLKLHAADFSDVFIIYEYREKGLMTYYNLNVETFSSNYIQFLNGKIIRKDQIFSN